MDAFSTTPDRFAAFNDVVAIVILADPSNAVAVPVTAPLIPIVLAVCNVAADPDALPFNGPLKTFAVKEPVKVPPVSGRSSDACPVTVPVNGPVNEPAATAPVTSSDVKVPTEVMAGCAAVVTVPAVVAVPADVAVLAFPVNAPTKVVDVTEVRPAREAEVVPSEIPVEPMVIMLFTKALFGMDVNPAPEPE
jgi:hypothetical protein